MIFNSLTSHKILHPTHNQHIKVGQTPMKAVEHNNTIKIGKEIIGRCHVSRKYIFLLNIKSSDNKTSIFQSKWFKPIVIASSIILGVVILVLVIALPIALTSKTTTSTVPATSSAKPSTFPATSSTNPSTVSVTSSANPSTVSETSSAGKK